MTYRDDRDALMARIDVLEQDLAETKAESEEEVARLESERDRLQLKLERLRRGEPEDGPPSSPTPPLPSSDFLSEREPGLLSRLWERVSGVVAGIVGIGLVGGLPIAVIMIPMCMYESCVEESLDRQATLVWSSTVASSRDTALAPGSPCEIRAQVRGDGEERFTVDNLTVSCGGREVYDWNDGYRGLSGDDAPSPRQECEELFQTEENGRYRFRLRCVDVEGRVGGRAEMSLDSERGQARVWRDTPPMLRIELDVESFSQPLQLPEPLIGPASTDGYWDGC